jgi:hypothetical protein
MSISPLDLAEQRVDVGDKLALVLKINQMQTKLEQFASELNTLAATLNDDKNSANQSEINAKAWALQAQAAAAGDVISDIDVNALTTWSSQKLNAAFYLKTEVYTKVQVLGEINKKAVTVATLMKVGAI